MSILLLSTSTLAAALLTSNTAFAQSDGQNQAPTPRATDIIVIGMLNTDQATAEIERTPGAVEVILDTAFENTPVQHIKDILVFALGVITQPLLGDVSRISVRGSGLPRAFGARGLSLLLDVSPFHTAHGGKYIFNIDPPT